MKNFRFRFLLKEIFFTSCILLIAFSTFAQAPPILWEKCLGGSGQEESVNICITNDGGYIVSGYTTSHDGDLTGDSLRNIWLIKLGVNGNIEWQKTYGGTGGDASGFIRQSFDGGYIEIGQTLSNDGEVSGNHGGEDIWVLKLDDTGKIQWQKCLGGSADENSWSIQQTRDSGYVLAGYTNSNNGDVTGYHGNTDAWVVKLDKNGTKVWTKTLGGSGYDDLNYILQTVDGGYLAVGMTSSNDGDVSGNHGGNDLWLVKLTAEGFLSWQKCLGGPASDRGFNAEQTPDKGYIIAGNSASNTGDVSGNHGGFADVWVVKTDSLGQIIWQKCRGGSDREFWGTIHQAYSGGYILEAETASNDGDVIGWHPCTGCGVLPEDYWVVRLDDTGEIKWQKCLGGSSEENSRWIEQDKDSSYIITGITVTNDDGDITGFHLDSTGHASTSDIWVVKLGKDPTTGVAVQNTKDNTSRLYPNPFVNEITIETKPGSEVVLTSVLGEIIFTLKISQAKQTIHIPDIPIGIYYLAISDAQTGRQVFKLLKN